MPTKRDKLYKLEALRGLAACCVIFSHVGKIFQEKAGLSRGAIIYAPFRFGQEAVMLFFILSGFVIYYSFCGRGTHRGLLDYFVRRLRRIYPNFIAALALAYICGCISAGRLLDPELPRLTGNLLMLQDYAAIKPGAIVLTYFSDKPLWSLAYEWWFYMLFPAIFFLVRPRWRLHAAALISLIGAIIYVAVQNGFAQYLSYFIIWWAGVELAKEFVESRAITFRRQWPTIACLAGVGLVYVFNVLRLDPTLQGNPGTYPLLQVRHFATAIVLIALAILWRKYRFIGFDSVIGIFQVFAPISYAMYIFHYPILRGTAFETGAIPWWVMLPAKLVLIVVISYLAEVVMQGYINRKTDALLARRRATPSMIGMT
ncbi:hypothetical protein BH09SUM1_BH09SUM1_17330 [soil metagenome]